MQDKGPWSGARPGILDLYGVGRDVFGRSSSYKYDPKTKKYVFDPAGGGPLQPRYRGETMYDPRGDYAGINWGLPQNQFNARQETAGLQGQLGRLYGTQLGDQRAVAAGALPVAQRTLAGGYLDTPGLSQAIQRETAPIYEQFREQVLPQLTSHAVTGRRFGSANFAQMQERALRNLGRSIADTTGRLTYDARERERGRQHELARGFLGQSIGLDADRLRHQIGTTADVGLDAARLRMADQERLDDRSQTTLANQLRRGALNERLGQRGLDIAQERWRRTDPQNIAYQNYMDRLGRDKREIGDYLSILRGDGSMTTQPGRRYNFGERLVNAGGGFMLGQNIADSIAAGRAPRTQFTPRPRTPFQSSASYGSYGSNPYAGRAGIGGGYGGSRTPFNPWGGRQNIGGAYWG